MVLMSEALRIVGGESQDDWLDDGAYVIGVGDTDSLKGRALLQPGASADLYVGAWLLFLEREHNKRERVIETYDPTLGIVGFPSFPFNGSPLEPAVQNGERYQVWTRFRPVDVERALLLALKNMFQIRVDSLSGVTINGLRQINLTTALPHLQSSNQVMAIGALDGTAPAASEAFAGGVSVGMDGALDVASSVSLSVQGSVPYGTGDTLTIYSLASWDAATTAWGGLFPQDLADGTTFAPAEWWAWEGLYRLARQTQYRDPDLEQRCIMRLNELRPMYAPEAGYRMLQPREPWGVGMNDW